MLEDGTHSLEMWRNSIGSSRRMLRGRIRAWRIELRKCLDGVLSDLGLEDDSSDDMELLVDDLDEEQLDPGAPEGETLGLPSSWSKDTLRDEWAMLCATYELTLRIGQAYDQLAEVRTKVRHRAVLIQVKDKHVRGQAANLRSKKDISATAKDAVAVADIYNHNFDRLVTLQSCLPPLPQGTWIPEPLRRIDTQKDLQVTSLKATRNAGDSKRTRSWIFHVVGPRSSSVDDRADWEQESEWPGVLPRTLVC